MSTRRPRPLSPHRRPRVVGKAGVLVVLAAGAITLAACSSSTTTTAPPSTTSTTSGISLSSLENWPTTAVSVTESGSTLLQPLFTLWATGISKSWPAVTVQPAGGGSGQGISNAAAGTSNIGASDAYLSPAQVAQYPSLADIPLAISYQQVNYNIPGLPASTHLKLTGKVLSAMYQGTITNWNDSQITALNPGVTIPSTPIAAIHRADSSGDTFLFTSYLSAADPSGWGTKYPANTTEQWPNAPGSASATGNGGMVTTCAATPGCVAYIGISYLSQTTSKGLGQAELQNASGNYELPSTTSAAAEAASYAKSTPASGAISMIYGPAKDGYPIVNYEYAIVGKQPDALHEQAVKAVLAWAVDPNGGNASSYLSQVQFVPLPSSVEQISLKLISAITS